MSMPTRADWEAVVAQVFEQEKAREATPARRCPHCGVVGHWPEYVRDELLAGRCPDSGEHLMTHGERRYCLGACDCFGYPVRRTDGPPLPDVH